MLRVKGQDPEDKIALLRKLLVEHGDKLENCFVVVTKAKFRFVPLKEGVRWMKRAS